MKLSAVVPVISLVLLTSGCSSLPDREQLAERSGALLSRSGEVISEQGQRIARFASSLVSDDEHTAEVDALFAQPYIDPLTRYLERYQDESAAARHLDRVAAERDRRCQVIADSYQQRAATRENLERYRRGYLYSCPDDVSAFARRLSANPQQHAQAQQPPAPVTPPARQSTPAADSDRQQQAVNHRQRNNCYLYFTIRNPQQAREYCQQPATAGDAKAQHHLASLARSAADYSTARQWARQSAEQGYAPGQLLYAQLLQQGQGGAADPAGALGWLQKAADQGLADAQFAAGQAYQQGLGHPVDSARSHRYWQQAAEQNHSAAQLALGSSLLEAGDARSGAARHWLTQAARQGSSAAQMRLADSFARGEGGSQDPEQAYIWYSLALLGGDDSARARAEAMAQQLSSEQLSRAQQRVRANHQQLP